MYFFLNIALSFYKTPLIPREVLDRLASDGFKVVGMTTNSRTGMDN